MGKRDKKERVRSLTLKKRKRLLSRVIEQAVVAPDKPHHRTKMAEHVVNVGLTMLEATTGICMDNAIVLAPEERAFKLLMTIVRHADECGVSTETICDQLIHKINAGEPLARAN